MRKTLNRLVFGLLFIGAGVGYLGNLVGFWTGFTIFFPGWWTLFIIVPMIFSMINDRPNWFNIPVLLLGVALLLSNDAYGIIEFKKFIWIGLAALLVAVGIRIIFAPVFNRVAARRRASSADGGDENTEYYTTGSQTKRFSVNFGDSREAYDGKEFEGAEINAVFGTFTLDLRNAVITHDVVIDADAAFGSVEILLPNNVNLRIDSNSFFGETSNRRTAPSDPALPTVFIKGDAAFGGITVK